MIRLAITPGEPAGIGPDLVVMVAQTQRDLDLVVYADPAVLRDRAQLLGLPLAIRPPDAIARAPGTLAVSPIATAVPVTPGQLDTANAPYVLETLTAALRDTLSGHCQALVTGPVNKGVINDAGIAFSGHTEFFAEQTETPRVVMMLATEGLKVALATTHLPLSEVAGAIRVDPLVATITLLDRELKACFGLSSPRIAVCGLNPHAGENGHMGREEIDIIAPALARCHARGIAVSGPHPADTLFTPKHLADCDAVLAMYHDQGLPVLKYKGFGAAVNITLGLPFIRTSVDHGTALDLAGTGNIDPGSFNTAIAYATAMAAHQDLP